MKTVMAGLYRLGRLSDCAFAIVTLFLLASAPALRAADPPKKPAPGADIFNGTNIVRMSITIPASAKRALSGYYWGNGGQEKPEAKVTVTEGTNVYKNVALHLKGSAGSFRPISDKPALTLHFDKYVQGQMFHGLSKISLNNSVQDPTYVEEKICREMYAAAGLPVPRADYALVTLDGRNSELYVLLEGYNKQFLKQHFKNVSGNLYDGGFCREITDDLGVNSGEKPNDKSDLQRLASAAASARQNNSLTELSQILDIDRFLTMIALEVIQCHWDGYTMNRNNYRLYHDLDSGKFIFMAHGMDQMFGTGDRGRPTASIFPSCNGFVSSCVLSTKEGRSRYLQKLTEVRTNVFKADEIVARVRQIAARIEPYSHSSYSHRSVSIEGLCQNIIERAKTLDDQLGKPTKLPNFTNGILRLPDWNERVGAAGFAITNSPDGKKLLHIAGAGNSASWRTRVVLGPGQYRVEGYVRTRGAGMGAAGAQLRISGVTVMPTLHGDNKWTMLNFPFEVAELTREVTVVCELKGGSGEAWFDTSSLKIRRIE
jgi:spore coat protein H